MASTGAAAVERGLTGEAVAFASGDERGGRGGGAVRRGVVVQADLLGGGGGRGAFPRGRYDEAQAAGFKRFGLASGVVGQILQDSLHAAGGAVDVAGEAAEVVNVGGGYEADGGDAAIPDVSNRGLQAAGGDAACGVTTGAPLRRE